MTRPDDLLAAYVDDALTTDERARVEAYLADNADARADVEQLRALLTDVRRSEPRPRIEPAWDDMAASIRDACGDADDHWVARALAWLRSRPLATGGGVAVAAAAGLILTMQTGDVAAPTNIAGLAAVVAPAPDPALTLPSLADAWESDAAGYELAVRDDVSDWFDPEQLADVPDASLEFDRTPYDEALLDDLTDDQLDALADTFELGRPS